MRQWLPDSLHYPDEAFADTGKRTVSTMAGLAFSLMAFNRPPSWGVQEVAGMVNYAGIVGRRTGRLALSAAVLSTPVPGRVLGLAPDDAARLRSESAEYQLLSNEW